MHHLLKADDCALYLVDPKRAELYLARDESNERTRYPFSVGIVGVVARTGHTIRISKDAFKDPRYDKRVDERKKHITHRFVVCEVSILLLCFVVI